MIFLTLCHLRRSAIEATQLVQVKERKGNPTRLKLPSAMNSGSQAVFLGTRRLNGDILETKQERGGGFSFIL